MLKGIKIRKLTESDLIEIYNANKSYIREAYNKMREYMEKGEADRAVEALQQMNIDLGVYLINDISEFLEKYKDEGIDIVFSHDPPYVDESLEIDTVKGVHAGDDELGKFIKEKGVKAAFGGHLEGPNRVFTNGYQVALPREYYTTLYGNVSTNTQYKPPIIIELASASGKTVYSYKSLRS